MKTAVVFKWTRNPQDAIVRADGEVSWNGVKMAPTDDDPAATDVAKAISAEEDIIGITVGDGKPEWAGARGASSTLIVEDVVDDPDGSVTAAAIAEAIKKAGDIDVVTIGDSEWNRAVPCALVGKLGWKAYANVIDARTEGDGLVISVKTPAGTQEISTSTPVLLETLALGQEENAPGMKQTLAAKKKPMDKVAAADLSIPASKATFEKNYKPEGNAVIMIDGSDPDAAVAELIKALQGDGVL